MLLLDSLFPLKPQFCRIPPYLPLSVRCRHDSTVSYFRNLLFEIQKSLKILLFTNKSERKIEITFLTALNDASKKLWIPEMTSLLLRAWHGEHWRDLCGLNLRPHHRRLRGHHGVCVVDTSQRGNRRGNLSSSSSVHLLLLMKLITF